MKKCQNCGKEYSNENSDEKKASNSHKYSPDKWKFSSSFMGHVDDELDPINELNICPDCYSIFMEESELKELKKPKKPTKKS